MRSSRWISILLIAALAQPLGTRARTDFEDLPRIGDAGADELSPQTERDIGEEVRRDFRTHALLIEDPEIVDYIETLGARLSASGPASGRSLEFFVVRDPSLNAFALPGGFIGVHTGLIVAAANESELASVLAHEIGHVTQRHIARMLAQNRRSSVVTLAALVLAVLAARSDPQAAGGIMALGQGVAQDQMLSFSRDAEREADRVGLEILTQADFDTNAMVSFFGRLQKSTRIYESGAPVYMRTHPLTTDRIADIQNRIRETRYRQHADTLEFTLVRAQLAALADTSVDGLRRAREAVERQLADRSFVNEAATRFHLAVIANAQHQYPLARDQLAQVHRLIGRDHPMLDRLAVDIEVDSARMAQALALSSAALGRFPGSRALAHQHAGILLRLARHAQAAEYLQASVAKWSSDSQLWRMLSEARFGAGQNLAGRRAAAEHYVLEGGLLAAIEQLRLAQREAGSDFYIGSQIDARLRELQTRYTRLTTEYGPQ